MNNALDHIKEFEPEIVENDDVKMVTFRFGHHSWDYAIITYHDSRGLLTITSSYGDWSYIWNAMGRDATLPEFFIDAHNEYLADKLYGPEQRDFNGERAIEGMKKTIIEDRKEDCLTKERAREIWQELAFLLDTNSRDVFYTEFFDSGLGDWVDEPWDMGWGLEYKSSYLILQERIIPMIRDYFRSKINDVSQAY